MCRYSILSEVTTAEYGRGSACASGFFALGVPLRTVPITSPSAMKSIVPLSR